MVGCSSLAIRPTSPCYGRNIQLAARQSSAPKPSAVLNILSKLSQRVGTCLVPCLMISWNSTSQNSKHSYSSRFLADLYSAVHAWSCLILLTWRQNLKEGIILAFHKQ